MENNDKKMTKNINTKKHSVQPENKMTVRQEINAMKEEVQKENTKPILKKTFHKKVINLIDFNKLDIKKQKETIKEILESAYIEEFQVTKTHILKCITLTCDPEDAITYLPDNLCVEKKGNKLIFKIQKKINLLLLLIFLGAFIFSGIAATYSAVVYLSRSELNIDLDDDGYADLNVDIDNDGYADINVDTDGDRKPDINIDYKKNWKSIFNIDLERTGIATANLLNQDTDGNGVCDLNCDSNDDGWPDYNLDLDGNGIADIDIDTNDDGFIDLNIDLNRDGKCDVMCDTDGDWKCNEKCIQEQIPVPVPVPDNSSSSSDLTSSSSSSSRDIVSSYEGDPNVINTTTTLKIIFKDSQEIQINNIYPDDEVGKNTKIPDKVFTIQSETATEILYYDIRWEVIANDFTTENLIFKVTSTNGGGTLDWTPLPKKNENPIFLQRVAIAPLTTQTYTMSFTLKGLGVPQNDDQGRTFIGVIQVDPVQTSEPPSSSSSSSSSE